MCQIRCHSHDVHAVMLQGGCSLCGVSRRLPAFLMHCVAGLLTLAMGCLCYSKRFRACHDKASTNCICTANSFMGQGILDQGRTRLMHLQPFIYFLHDYIDPGRVEFTQATFLFRPASMYGVTSSQNSPVILELKHCLDIQLSALGYNSMFCKQHWCFYHKGTRCPKV